MCQTHVDNISELTAKIEKLESDNLTLYQKLRFTQSFQSGSPSDVHGIGGMVTSTGNNVFTGSSSSNGQGGLAYKPSEFDFNYADPKLSKDQMNARRTSAVYLNMSDQDRLRKQQQQTVANRNSNEEVVTSKYQSMYEGNLDPFQRFNRQVRNNSLLCQFISHFSLFLKEETRRLRSMNTAERVTYNLTRMILVNKYSRWLFVCYSGLLHMLVLFSLYELSSQRENQRMTNA